MSDPTQVEGDNPDIETGYDILVPSPASPDDLLEEDVFEGYIYVVGNGAWICPDCKGLTIDIPGHNEWHARLDSRNVIA